MRQVPRITYGKRRFYHQRKGKGNHRRFILDTDRGSKVIDMKETEFSHFNDAVKLMEDGYQS